MEQLKNLIIISKIIISIFNWVFSILFGIDVFNHMMLFFLGYITIELALYFIVAILIAHLLLAIHYTLWDLEKTNLMFYPLMFDPNLRNWIKNSNSNNR